MILQFWGPWIRLRQDGPGLTGFFPGCTAACDGTVTTVRGTCRLIPRVPPPLVRRCSPGLPEPCASDASSAEARVVPGRIEHMRAEAACLWRGVFFYREVASLPMRVKVMPGEYFVHSEDLVITTTHFVHRRLPVGSPGCGRRHQPFHAGRRASDDGGRYGSCAMELHQRADQRGATGARSRRRSLAAQRRSPAMARSMSASATPASVRLSAHRGDSAGVSDVLRPYPRKVCFFPRPGARWLPVAGAKGEAAIALDQDARRRASGVRSRQHRPV